MASAVTLSSATSLCDEATQTFQNVESCRHLTTAWRRSNTAPISLYETKITFTISHIPRRVSGRFTESAARPYCDNITKKINTQINIRQTFCYIFGIHRHSELGATLVFLRESAGARPWCGSTHAIICHSSSQVLKQDRSH